MTEKNKQIVSWVIIAVVIIAGIGFLFARSGKAGKLDEFAQCLEDKGAVFYGAFWCTHCQNQKELFGSSQKYLPYVECSTVDGKSQLPVCQEKQIQGYPLWEFSDGSKLSGEIPLETLAEKTGCQLPQQ